jgi:NAD(P)-dependent dehydrogenase (short-subunit alcohol dehydrogenase family)
MAQTILVTGSTSGFGRFMVETLARQGYQVFAGMRDIRGKNTTAADEIHALAAKDQYLLQAIELDVTDETTIERAISSIVAKTGRLDVVVNNAGVSYFGPLEAFSLAQVQQQFDTNVFSVWRVNHAAIPQMRQQGSGLLIQIGSIVGRIALPYLGLYAASKFALEGLTEAYQYELAPFGIGAVIIEPGTFPTPISAKRQVAHDSTRFALYQEAIDAFLPPFYAENRSETPPNPQDVADAVADIIAQPAEKRPLRTVVATPAQRQAPQAINDAVTEATHHFRDTLHLPLPTLASRANAEEEQQ